MDFNDIVKAIGIEPYYRDNNVAIFNGDCKEILPLLSNIDAIVTDPPYGLTSIVNRFSNSNSHNTPAMNTKEGSVWARKAKGFMGKEWDGTGVEYDVEMWQGCFNALKSGGHLLSFGGTRTYHRMACAIEDAGFEIRDMIEWVYGCLSEDTEILTESGYKPLHKLTQYDRIGVYDITNNIYKWERPQRWSVYKVHQDTAYRIKSDYTDQIVSRNHRCLVEREGKLVFIQADELNEVEYMPTLSDDFYTLQEGHRKLLLKELLRKGKGLVKTLFSKWIRKEVSEQRIEVRKEPSLERWSNLLEETRKLQADKICEVSEGVFTDGEKRWICNGTSFDNGSILGDMFRKNPSSASYQSRPTRQQTGKSDVISIKQGTQITRRATVTKIEYSGIIFCPTVSTGAFVARRNGQVFITGNSGFPKSLNIGKAVDKLQGNEREVVGEKVRGDVQKAKESGSTFAVANANKNNKAIFGYGVETLTKGTSEWEGWGTALKPAHEPICMARKPIKGTVADNVLKYGTGGINIDGCRVEIPENDKENYEFNNNGLSRMSRPEGDKLGQFDGGWKIDKTKRETPQGRFPANLIHDGSEEVLEIFPNCGNGNGKGAYNYSGREYNNKDTSMFNGDKPQAPSNFNDNGSAARFFYQAQWTPEELNILEVNTNNELKQKWIEIAKLYNDIDLEPIEAFIASMLKSSMKYCAKASKSERNDGCDELELKQPDTSRKEGNVGGDNPRNRGVNKVHNFHPTVKPLALMEYLIKLITPPKGIVLDPFMGSGSTLIAARKLGYKAIGIELNKEYAEIAVKRLAQGVLL